MKQYNNIEQRRNHIFKKIVIHHKRPWARAQARGRAKAMWHQKPNACPSLPHPIDNIILYYIILYYIILYYIILYYIILYYIIL